MKLNHISPGPPAAPPAAHAGRPRHRLGQGQDRGSRHQRPEVAHRRLESTASKAARCRCIAACPSAGSNTNFPCALNKVNLGGVQAAVDAKLLDAGAVVDAAA